MQKVFCLKMDDAPRGRTTKLSNTMPIEYAKSIYIYFDCVNLNLRQLIIHIILDP